MNHKRSKKSKTVVCPDCGKSLTVIRNKGVITCPECENVYNLEDNVVKERKL